MDFKMRIRQYIALCLLLTSGVGISFAQHISINKAIDIGVRFFEQEVVNSISPRYAPAMGGNQMATAKVLRYADRECMYAVSMPDSGWVLVAADERVVPILAISYDGTFPADEDMPPAMRDLFEDYANEIVYIQDSINGEPHPEWAALENNTYGAQAFSAETGSDIYTPGDALLNRPDRGEVKWDQAGCNKSNPSRVYCDYVYNKFCPDWYQISCGRTYVGCTAVAMAQIMWYWQWPHTGYIPVSINKKGEPSKTTELHLYNWNLMPKEIADTTSVEEVNMIAGFLRDCGYTSKMKYEEDGSGASLKNAMAAMTDVFFYNDNMRHKQKALTINWAKKLREEINAGRPVLYAGYGDAGHAFVIDGYKESNPDYFHVNWGWGSTESNYFLLDNLYGNGHTFNSRQEALFGIKPDPDCAPYSTNGTKTLRYGTAGTLTINTAVESGEFGVYYSGTEVRLKPGFHAKQGSKLHVAIQHFPCDGIAPQSLRAPQHTQEEAVYDDITASAIRISPNPTTGLLNIESDKAIQSVAVYQLDGQKITEQTGNAVELYAASAGIYIVHIYFTDGSVYTDKVIKTN